MRRNRRQRAPGDILKPGIVSQVRSNAALPRTNDESGSRKSSPQSESCGWAAYHATMRWALRDGSDSSGATWRTNRAATNRMAGQTRTRPNAAITSLVKLIVALYSKGMAGATYTPPILTLEFSHA
jgi:hypothetical protein